MGLEPEQLREAIKGFTAKGEPDERNRDLNVLLAAARELLALKEVPTHPDYDVALPEIEEWVNRNGAW